MTRALYVGMDEALCFIQAATVHFKLHPGCESFEWQFRAGGMDPDRLELLAYFSNVFCQVKQAQVENDQLGALTFIVASALMHESCLPNSALAGSPNAKHRLRRLSLRLDKRVSDR